MDKLEIKQASFIQQTQYFIPVEIDLSVVPARLRISQIKTLLLYHLSFLHMKFKDINKIKVAISETL
jgi:hypothetical protein